MTAGDELHAPHLDADILDRNPEVRGDQGRVECVGLVLMPGGRPAVVRGFVDGVVEAIFDRPGQQRLGERPAPPEGLRLLQLRLQLDRLIDLEDFR